MSDSDEPDERDYPDDFDWTSREGQDEAYDWACDNWDAAPSAIPPHDGFVTPRGRVFPWGQEYGGLLISMSPLREVMQRGDVDALRALHEGEQGPLDLDQRFGWLGGHEEKECVRLCFLSAERGHTAMIIYMIEQGADVVSSGRYDFDGIHIVSTPLDNTASTAPSNSSRFCLMPVRTSTLWWSRTERAHWKQPATGTGAASPGTARPSSS